MKRNIMDEIELKNKTVCKDPIITRDVSLVIAGSSLLLFLVHHNKNDISVHKTYGVNI